MLHANMLTRNILIGRESRVSREMTCLSDAVPLLSNQQSGDRVVSAVYFRIVTESERVNISCGQRGAGP